MSFQLKSLSHFLPTQFGNISTFQKGKSSLLRTFFFHQVLVAQNARNSHTLILYLSRMLWEGFLEARPQSFCEIFQVTSSHIKKENFHQTSKFIHLKLYSLYQNSFKKFSSIAIFGERIMVLILKLKRITQNFLQPIYYFQ